MDEAQEAFGRQHPSWHKGWAMTADDAPAFWNAGTYWRFLSTDASTSGRSTTFEELRPPGVVAPPGTYIYIAPGTRHGFRCDSEVGRVFNTLVPGGFDHGISEQGIPAPQVAMPPPGVSALPVWRELDARVRPRW